ncbi:MAG TPA: VWA domain-containing protein [Vicinamibacterales bacterium]|nr:VWA domain-containing protein [Vicinamibacterales bacterium]
MRRTLVLFALVAVVQQTPPPQDPTQKPPTFRTRIDSVSVDVTVTDRQGRPVTDLTPADFEIREGGKVQAIDTFKLIAADMAEPATPLREITSFSDQAREVADDRNRVFIIFLDDYHVRQSNSMRVREQLARFVSNLGSRDLVAILYPLTPVAAATFSRNHAGTAGAIMNFWGRKYDYTPKNLYEERYQGMPPEQQERMRNDLTLFGLEQACIFLGTLREGRKTLLFISEGLSGTLPAGTNVKGTIIQPAGTPSQTQQFFASTQLLSQMQQVFAAASRANTSIFTLDPRGLATSEFDISDTVRYEQDKAVLQESMDSLRVLADNTDGRAIVNRNDPIPELQRMMRELSAYYLLGYTSSIAPRDGKFQQIQVRVKRPNLEVRARKGYWAYTAEEVEKASATPKPGPPREVATALEEMATIVEPGSRRSLNLWLGARRGPTEKALVTLVWEAGATPTDSGEAIEKVTVTAHAISGEALLSNAAVARDATRPRPGGVVTFEAPAGAVQVRATAENGRGHRLDTEELSYDVPDFTTPGPTLSAPMLYRARTAREIQDLRAAPEAPPTTSRQFSRTERLLLRFDAYGPAATRPAIALRLLNRMGEGMADLPAPAAVRQNGFESEIGLGGLPPGDYIIEIAATSNADTVKKLLAIRITG